MFSRLLTLAAFAMAVASFTSHTSLTGHLILLAPFALLLWFLQVTWRPLRRCEYCDNGKDWDDQREHYGEHCPGGRFGLGSCGGIGKKLRWEAHVLRMVGAGRALRNLPDAMRGIRDD